MRPNKSGAPLTIDLRDLQDSFSMLKSGMEAVRSLTCSVFIKDEKKGVKVRERSPFQ